MHNKFFIAIDSGKSYTKGVIRTENKLIERVKFRTKVMEANGFDNDTLMKNTDVIEYERKEFLIGDLVSEDYVSFDLTKQTNEHLISIYLAITKLLERSQNYTAMAKIYLAVNIPINLYKNEQKRREYEAFIHQNGKVIGIQVNGKPYSFTLEKVIALPEALGPIYYQSNDFRHKRALIFDIGSLNTSILECNRLIPNLDRMLISNLGINILRSSIAEQLSSRYALSLTSDDAEQILRDKRIIVDGTEQKEGNEIIKSAFEQHVKHIINYAKSRKISFANTELIFIGGGSILLEKQFLKHFPNVIFIPREDSQFSNTLSFLKILEAKSNEQRKA